MQRNDDGTSDSADAMAVAVFFVLFFCCYYCDGLADSAGTIRTASGLLAVPTESQAGCFSRGLAAVSAGQ